MATSILPGSDGSFNGGSYLKLYCYCKKGDIYHFFAIGHWTKASAIAVLTADTV